MSRKKYLVTLKSEEHQELLDLTRKGTIRARKMKRAQILLHAHDGLTDPEIMAAVQVSRPCVERIRKRFVEGGLPKALNEDPRPGQRRKLDPKQEARLIAEACRTAPPGHAHWSLRLLAGRVVELGLTDRISHEAVRQILKKTNSSPGRNANGVFPQSVPTL